MFNCENCVSNKQMDSHVKLFHPFLFDKVNTSPVKGAIMDDAMYEVSKVEAHTFIGNKEKQRII